MYVPYIYKSGARSKESKVISKCRGESQCILKEMNVCTDNNVFPKIRKDGRRAEKILSQKVKALVVRRVTIRYEVGVLSHSFFKHLP